jgi:1-acyl-sn-glycerol-3-phosphate acyltransferase
VFTRDEPGELRPGVALLARRSGCPVVPVHICGSATAWPRGRRLPRPSRVRVRVGPPIVAEARGRDCTERLIARIEAALDEGP